MERGGRGLTQVVQDFIHNYRLKPIFEEAVAWKQHWGRVAGLLKTDFYRFLASCFLATESSKLEPKRIRDVLNQKSHPRDLRYPEICHCQVVRFLQVPGAVNDMGKVDVGRVRESHGSRRK